MQPSVVVEMKLTVVKQLPQVITFSASLVRSQVRNHAITNLEWYNCKVRQFGKDSAKHMYRMP